MEPSGKYFANLLYEGYSCENQAAEPDYSTAKILGIDYAMQGMAVFSKKSCFFRLNLFLKHCHPENTLQACFMKDTAVKTKQLDRITVLQSIFRMVPY